MYKDYKLRESAEFQRVFEQNKSLRDRYWLILYRPNDLGIARFGVAVSKKNVNKAVQRNRIKRIIRETFRQNRGKLGGVDIVVLVRKGISEIINRELNSAIIRQWHELAQKSSK